MPGELSLSASSLPVLEENTSLVATRSLQIHPTSTSQPNPRHVVHLADDKKAGDMGVILMIFAISIFGFLILGIYLYFLGSIASSFINNNCS